VKRSRKVLVPPYNLPLVVAGFAIIGLLGFWNKERVRANGGEKWLVGLLEVVPSWMLIGFIISGIMLVLFLLAPVEVKKSYARIKKLRPTSAVLFIWLDEPTVALLKSAVPVSEHGGLVINMPMHLVVDADGIGFWYNRVSKTGELVHIAREGIVSAELNTYTRREGDGEELVKDLRITISTPSDPLLLRPSLHNSDGDQSADLEMAIAFLN
jgi:hypothetical protein